MQQLRQMAPYRGYLKAHDGEQHPFELLGGPITAEVDQDSGGVFVALPDHRQLDPQVFGTPKQPRAFAGTPVVDGLPVSARGVSNGQFTTAKPLSPFGDKYIVMAGGHLKLHAVDATATDAATTGDRVKMDANWQDKAGNTYEVRCCKMVAAHSTEYPTLGGVVTNTILHGSSRVGTALMPTEYTDLAFWGMGEVLQNGRVVAAPRLIHGMLIFLYSARGSRYAGGCDCRAEIKTRAAKCRLRACAAPSVAVAQAVSIRGCNATSV